MMSRFLLNIEGAPAYYRAAAHPRGRNPRAPRVAAKPRRAAGAAAGSMNKLMADQRRALTMLEELVPATLSGQACEACRNRGTMMITIAAAWPNADDGSANSSGARYVGLQSNQEQATWDGSFSTVGTMRRLREFSSHLPRFVFDPSLLRRAGKARNRDDTGPPARRCETSY
jgi:hypothetical protein